MLKLQLQLALGSVFLVWLCSSSCPCCVLCTLNVLPRASRGRRDSLERDRHDLAVCRLSKQCLKTNSQELRLKMQDTSRLGFSTRFAVAGLLLQPAGTVEKEIQARTNRIISTRIAGSSLDLRHRARNTGLLALPNPCRCFVLLLQNKDARSQTIKHCQSRSLPSRCRCA